MATTENPTVVVNPQVRIVQRLRVLGALGIETSTGLRHSRGSVMNLANEMLSDWSAAHPDAVKYFPRGWGTHRTKKATLADYVLWLMVVIDYAPRESVTRVLGQDTIGKFVRHVGDMRVMAVKAGADPDKLFDVTHPAN